MLTASTTPDLRRASNGTKSSNEQLFPMLFGYLVVRTLLPPVRFLGRRPDGLSWGSPPS